MNANDERIKPPTDLRSVARSITMMMAIVAAQSAAGALKDLVGDGTSTAIHTLVTALTKAIWSADVNAKPTSNPKERIDV